MAHDIEVLEVRLGAQGRVVIPAGLRKRLGVGEGDTLLAHADEGRIVLEKAETVKRRLKARFSVLDKKVSLANELIADRRAEAKRESEE